MGLKNTIDKILEELAEESIATDTKPDFVDFGDSFLTRFHGRIADAYQQKTYKPKDNLANLLSITGSSLFILGGISGNPWSIAFATFTTIENLAENLLPRLTSRVAEGDDSTLYEKSKIRKIIDIGFYTTGITMGCASGALILYSVIAGELDSVEFWSQQIALPLGFISWKTSTYLRSSDPGEPPKGPKQLTLMERIKQYAPKPVPIPVTVNNRGAY